MTVLRPFCTAFALSGALSGALAAAAMADISRLPGTYRAEAGGAACRVRLDPPARAPEDSLIVADTVSGLVLAFPGCPGGLGDALLWRAAADGESLRLIDGAGAVVFEATPGENRSWSGETAAGETLTLNPA
ncbi:hypothetical protein ACWCOP_14355 [Maricaulaceae bacterium MS644]